MCRADLTKWPDENAPVALAIVKRDPQKIRQMPSDERYVREMAARVQVRAPNILTLSWLRCELERDKRHMASLHCVRKKSQLAEEFFEGLNNWFSESEGE